MKILRSFLLVTICVSTTAVLQAQEVKTEILKSTEVKASPAATAGNNPSPAPQLKPMNGVSATATAPVAAAQTPSPFTKDKDNKNGAIKTEPLKPITPVIATDVPPANTMVLPVPAPVVIKQQ